MLNIGKLSNIYRQGIVDLGVDFGKKDEFLFLKTTT